MIKMLHRRCCVQDRTLGIEERMGGFDLIWRDGPVSPTPAAVWGCLMGADFDKALNVFKSKGPAGAGAGAGFSTGPPAAPFMRPAAASGTGGLVTAPSASAGAASGPP